MGSHMLIEYKWLIWLGRGYIFSKGEDLNINDSFVKFNNTPPCNIEDIFTELCEK